MQAVGEAWSEWENVGAGARGVTVGNLVNGREYVFEVRAVNGLGKGGAGDGDGHAGAADCAAPAAAEAEVEAEAAEAACCFHPRRRWA